KIIESLAKHLLVDAEGRENEALHFNFSLDLSIYSPIRVSVRKGLHLLYYKKPHSATVSVFSAVVDSPFDGIEKVEEWEHEISHDSCWREITTINNLYFQMAERINNKLLAAG